MSKLEHSIFAGLYFGTISYVVIFKSFINFHNFQTLHFIPFTCFFLLIFFENVIYKISNFYKKSKYPVFLQKKPVFLYVLFTFFVFGSFYKNASKFFDWKADSHQGRFIKTFKDADKINELALKLNKQLTYHRRTDPIDRATDSIALCGAGHCLDYLFPNASAVEDVRDTNIESYVDKEGFVRIRYLEL